MLKKLQNSFSLSVIVGVFITLSSVAVAKDIGLVGSLILADQAAVNTPIPDYDRIIGSSEFNQCRGITDYHQCIATPGCVWIGGEGQYCRLR